MHLKSVEIMCTHAYGFKVSCCLTVLTALKSLKRRRHWQIVMLFKNIKNTWFG